MLWRSAIALGPVGHFILASERKIVLRDGKKRNVRALRASHYHYKKPNPARDASQWEDILSSRLARFGAPSRKQLAFLPIPAIRRSLPHE
jgi:hypothetical protein